MRNTSSLLVLLFLAMALVLVGCGTQETTPSPTPTPKPTPPPVTATGNKHCASGGGGNSCDLTSDQVFDEDHGPDKSQHTCSPWDDNGALHITKMNAGAGKFKKIHVKGGGSHPNFDITVEACPGSTGNPFPHAVNSHHNDWDSGDLDPSIKDGSHYRLIMAEKTAKGKKMSDPHIVITP